MSYLKFADIDECVEETDNCDDNAACTNTEGSFTCLCDTGYSGSGASCTGELLDVVHSIQYVLLCIIYEHELTDPGLIPGEKVLDSNEKWNISWEIRWKLSDYTID